MSQEEEESRPPKRARWKTDEDIPRSVYMGGMRGHEPPMDFPGYNPEPLYVKNLSEAVQVKQVSCSRGRTSREMAYVLTTDGDLRPWAALAELDESKQPPWFHRDHNQRTLLPTILRNVNCVVSGSAFHMASTNDGSIYRWGSDTDIKKFRDQKWRQGCRIKMMSIAFDDDSDERNRRHTMFFLTDDGELYALGPKLPRGSGSWQQPTNILSDVVHVSSFDDHAAAVTSDGHLCTWGCGEYGRLGHGDEDNCNEPTCVDVLHPDALPEGKVVQAACGTRHTLALTSSGKVYAFGGNDSGQIGKGALPKYTSPTLVDGLSDYKISKVECSDFESYALSAQGKLFSWGVVVTGIRYDELVHEAYEFTGTVKQATPTSMKKFCNQKVVDIHCCGDSHFVFVEPHGDYIPMKAAFSVNDDEFSDVHFEVDNDRIPAHRYVLARRCEYFRKMFTSGMKEATGGKIVLPGMSKEAVVALIHYLYTDMVDVELPFILELYQAADMVGLPKLQKACEVLLKKRITVEDAVGMLQKLQYLGYVELKADVMAFVRENFKKVSRTAAMNHISKDLLLEIVKDCDLKYHAT